MLIIARKPQQSITITTPSGDTITVMITEVRSRHQVAVGIEAPEHIGIVATEKAEPEEPARRKCGRCGNECYGYSAGWACHCGWVYTIGGAP